MKRSTREWQSLYRDHLPAKKGASTTTTPEPILRRAQRFYYRKREDDEHYSWMNLGLHSDPRFPLHLPEIQEYHQMCMESSCDEPEIKYSPEETRRIFQASLTAVWDYEASDWHMVIHKPHGYYFRRKKVSISKLYAMCDIFGRKRRCR